MSIADFKSESEPTEKEVIEIIFAYYQTEIDAESRITTKRRALLGNRYREGWSLEQMKQAVDGCRDDPWEERRNCNAIENIFGKPENIERFIKISKNGTANGKSQHSTSTGQTQRRNSGTSEPAYNPWADSKAI